LAVSFGCPEARNGFDFGNSLAIKKLGSFAVVPQNRGGGGLKEKRVSLGNGFLSTPLPPCSH